MRFSALSPTLPVLLAVLLSFVVTAMADPVDDELHSQRRELWRAFAEKVADVAVKCDELKLEKQAALTRDWLIPLAGDRQYVFLPEEVDPLAAQEGASQNVLFWHKHFRDVRAAYAEQLFVLSKSALSKDRSALAYQLLHETLHQHSDHEQARRVLGYRKVNGRWRRPTSNRRISVVRIRNSELGFPARGHWRVESPNFRILTNHSKAAGEKLSRQLEDLQAVWRQVFFRYWSSPAQLQREFESGAAATRGGRFRKHQVVLFRDRDDYVRALTPVEPRIGKTLGLYLNGKRTAYFYEGGDPSTRFHEVTHQLFFESGPVVEQLGENANFWALEGVAMYMEALRPGDGYYTVGGVDANRLQFARYQLRNKRKYWPFGELTSLGKDAVQRHEEVGRIYSHAAGLSAMFIDGRQGAWRRGFIDYLRVIHRDPKRVASLYDFVDISAEGIQEQYLQFLDVSDEQLLERPRLTPLVNVAVGRTQITDKGLASLAGETELEWLDAAFTSVSDQGVAALKDLRKLKQLNLEGTKISDKALETVAQFAQLEELDLSKTNISDRGIGWLLKLKNLRVLWLTDTQLSNAGAARLKALRNLESLDVNGTQVSREVYESLKKALPNLN